MSGMNVRPQSLREDVRQLRAMVAQLQADLRLNTAPGPIHNVKRPPYNAAGNGVDDDRAAIQSAITGAIASNGAVYLPAGTYHVSGTLTIAGDVVIEGAGRDETIMDGGGAAASFITFDNATTINRFKMRGVTVQNFDNSGVFAGSLQTSLSKVKIHDCRFSTLDYAINLRSAALGEVHITDNVMDTLVSAGIQLGSNDFSNQDTMQKFVVRGNIITDVDDTTATGRPNSGGADTKGVLVYGREAVITGNIIQGVVNDNETDCEGIYTKCRRAVIANNVLRNAGRSEACIIVKGNRRGETVAPQGFGVIVANNHVWMDVDGARGIRVHNENALIVGNIIEGAGLQGIDTGDVVLNNIQIKNNDIYNTRGDKAIYIIANGRGIQVTGNTIDGVSNAANTGDVNGWGIRVDGGGAGRGVLVAENHITDVNGIGTGTARGIQVFNDDSLIGVTVHSNEVHDVDIGLRISGTASIGRVDVEGNRFATISTTDIDYDPADLTNSWFGRNGIRDHDGVQFADGDATPNVYVEDGWFETANTTATTITNFDNGYDGQIIVIHFRDGNTTIQDGTNIFLAGSANWSPGATDTLTLQRRGGSWYELSRSDN